GPAGAAAPERALALLAVQPGAGDEPGRAGVGAAGGPGAAGGSAEPGLVGGGQRNHRRSHHAGPLPGVNAGPNIEAQPLPRERQNITTYQQEGKSKDETGYFGELRHGTGGPGLVGPAGAGAGC